jgi:hypothetical protein
MPSLVEIVEVDVVNLVHDLPDEMAGFHVVIGVLEHVAHHAPPVARLAGELQLFQRRKQFVIDEIQQRLAGDALGVRRPAAPLILLRDRRTVAVPGQFEFLILIVDDLEEEHPA